MSELRIRCDGGGKIGMGHVMRCLALAHACREAGFSSVLFFTRESDGVAAREIAKQGFVVKIIPDHASEKDEIARLSDQSSGEFGALILVDSYAIGPEYLRELRNHGLKTCAIDDLADRPFPVDLLINHNVGSEILLYETNPETRLLLGPRYALVRTPFRNRAKAARNYPAIARRALITLGGSDPGDWTSFVLRALQGIDDNRLGSMELLLILGPSYRGKAHASVANWKGSIPKPRIETNCEEMDARMTWADLAVTASSSTCYESCCLRLPAITLTTEENQRHLETGFLARQCMLPLGWAPRLTEDKLRHAFLSLATNPALRQDLGERAGRLVDGEGARRVAHEILALANASTLPIKHA